MKRNVVLAATARLAASLFALILLTVAPALAGDRALLNVLGYSEDGTYIAFEEFGVLDGSGGYYSHIFVVALEKDSWEKGSPYSLETPGADGADARRLDRRRYLDRAQADAEDLPGQDGGPVLGGYGARLLARCRLLGWHECAGAQGRRHAAQIAQLPAGLPALFGGDTARERHEQGRVRFELSVRLRGGQPALFGGAARGRSSPRRGDQDEVILM